MKWNENPSDQSLVPDRWGLGESLASVQNTVLQTTQKPPPWFLARWRFSEEWGGNWTSWLENTLKIAFMLPEWWKGPTASERGFIIWDVACAQNGIRHWTSSPEMSIWEQGSSLLNQLWFIQENWKMKWANFQLFFPFFCMSHLFRSISLALKVRFSGPVPQVNAIICLCLKPEISRILVSI